MTMASADFTFLETPQGTKIIADALISLMRLVEDSMTIPPVRQTSLCFPRQFATINAVNVILMANERECSGERAPALVSVLGVTDWYTEQISTAGVAAPPGGAPDELVLGKYPLAFVQEATLKIGPMFYSIYGQDCSARQLPVLILWPLQDANEDAPWRIAIVGGRCLVLITSAVIGARSNEECRARYLTDDKEAGRANSDRFTMDLLGFPPRHGRVKNLQKVLHTITQAMDKADYHAFAVHLAQDSIAKIGIILAGCSGKDGILALSKGAVYIMKHDSEDFNKIYRHGIWPEMPKEEAVR